MAFQARTRLAEHSVAREGREGGREGGREEGTRQGEDREPGREEDGTRRGESCCCRGTPRRSLRCCTGIAQLRQVLRGSILTPPGPHVLLPGTVLYCDCSLLHHDFHARRMRCRNGFVIILAKGSKNLAEKEELKVMQW